MDEPEPGLYILSQIFTLHDILLPFTLDALFSVLSIVLLIILSGLISGSEIAYFSLDPADIEELKAKDNHVNKHVLTHLDSPKKLLATILISNNFINVSTELIICL